MRLLTVDGHWRWPGRRDGLEATLVIEGAGRWIRLGAFYGEAPGSHMAGKHATAWRTDCGPGEVRGWNARFGIWPYECLTFLAHTRSIRQ